MDPVKLDEIWKKGRAERTAQLKELEAQLKELKEERSLLGAKATDDASKKLSEMEKFLPFLAEASKKQRAALREAYRNREPPILRLSSHEDPCPYCTAASPPAVIMPPAFSEDGEGKAA